MTDIVSKLNKALKPKVSSGIAETNLRHENEVAILDAARKLLAKSESGAELLRYAQDSNLQMHVLRGKEKFGFYPEKSTVYISTPAGQTMPNVRAVIHLAGAIREAMQEGMEGLQRPNPRLGKERFVTTEASKVRDIAMVQTFVVHEIYEATGLLEIIDEFRHMGYSSLIEAHQRDLAGEASK